MNPLIKIIACGPADVLFAEVLPKIYGNDSAAQIHDEIDEGHLVKCLVVTQENEVLGRLAIYRNEALMHYGKAVIQLGNFECVHNYEAAKALLGAGLAYARRLGASFVIGPMNGSTWHQYRFISGPGDAPLFFTEQAHPDYYPALWEDAGFVPFQQYLSDSALIPALPFDVSPLLAAHGFSVRGIDTANLSDELEMLYPLCIAAFVKNPLSSTISKDKFVAKLMPLKPFLSPSFTRIVSDQTGTPIAFILCLPDIYDKSAQTIILKTAAKHPDCHAPGLMSELYRSIMAKAYCAGFRKVIHAFIHLDNSSLKRSRQFDGKPIRHYTLYIHPC